MLTAGTEGTMYEIASEIFDKVVFVYDDDLDTYNSHREMESMLDEIIGEMIEAADDAMWECVEARKEEFLEELRRLA